MLELQKQAEQIISLVKVTSQRSPFPCFMDKDCDKILVDLRYRLCVGLSTEQVAERVISLIRDSASSYGTFMYDDFQYLQNGILQ
jgi:hypothetical protein